MQISDEAVEAAIDAALAVRRQQHVNGTAGRHYQEIVAALEAAAPYIAAEAWDRAAASIVDEHGNPIIPDSNANPYRSQA